MAINFVMPLDLHGLELLNFLAQKLATAPTHAEGRIYYDTTLGKLRVGVAGSTWETLGESTSGMTSEEVQDIVGGMTAGSGLISVVYNDGAGTMTISTTATANDTDANLKNRANHTGTQAASTISDFTTSVQGLVDASISALVDSSPGTLDTLNELAAALGDDPNFATTITTSLGLKNETYTVGVGNGSLTSIAVTHSFGTKAVNVSVYETATPFAQVIPEVRYTDTNTVTLIFGVAPTTNQYTVVVQG